MTNNLVVKEQNCSEFLPIFVFGDASLWFGNDTGTFSANINCSCDTWRMWTCKTEPLWSVALALWRLPGWQMEGWAGCAWHKGVGAVLATVSCCWALSLESMFAVVMRTELSLQVYCLEETLEKSLQAEGSPDFRVSILLDYTRGSRGRNCCSLLLSEPDFTVRLERQFFSEWVSWPIGLTCLSHAPFRTGLFYSRAAYSQKIFKLSSFSSKNRW